MKRVRDREELKTRLLGRTRDEVKTLLGAPVRTTEVEGNPVWTYQGISRDPATGIEDRFTDVFFESGKVARVRF